MATAPRAPGVGEGAMLGIKHLPILRLYGRVQSAKKPFDYDLVEPNFAVGERDVGELPGPGETRSASARVAEDAINLAGHK
jgi:hypothetical protein